MKNRIQNRRGRWRCSATAWAACTISLWLGVTPAMADPQLGSGLETSKPVLEWFIGAIFVVATLIVAFKNAKRSNVH